MGTVETKSKGGKYIKSAARDSIKRMAYMSQIARCVSLMPTPEEFSMRVVSEVSDMMCRIKGFSDRVGAILDAYANLPADFVSGSTANILGSVSGAAGAAADAAYGMSSALNRAAGDVDSITGGTVTPLTKVVDGEGLSKAGDNLSSAAENLQSVIVEIDRRLDSVRRTASTAFGNYMVPDGTPAEDLVSATEKTAGSVSKLFDIRKVSAAFAGIAVETGLICAGLDSLPQLDMGKVLAFGRSETGGPDNITSSAVRQYKESEEYMRMVEDAEGDKRKMRESLRRKRKLSAQERRRGMESVTPEERAMARSVAKDVRNAKMRAKAAKAAQKRKEVVMLEMGRFVTDMNRFGTDIMDEWDMMERQYAEAVREIKGFFTGDPGSCAGSKYIDDCCDAIEVDCDSIKEVLKNLTVTITVSVSQVPSPTSLGSCFDNPLYKVLRWFECAKVIFNEIRKVINFGIDMVKQIDNLVKIMLNGINDARKVKENLMEILNIKWLLDFIESVIDLFSTKSLESKELIENSISPVYYSETDEYERRMESLEKRIDGMDDGDGTKKVEKDMENLEKEGENICAYKSPLLNEDGSEFKAWIFYHQNIDNRYRSNQKLKQKFSVMMMKRAAKTGEKKKGGVNMLKRKKVFRLGYGMKVDGGTTYTPAAYDAFYWYTKWTTDPNDDTLDKNVEMDEDGNVVINNFEEHDDIVSPIMATENGTLVELSDGRRVFVNDYGVKAGDYILVEGKRYRVSR